LATPALTAAAQKLPANALLLASPHALLLAAPYALLLAAPHALGDPAIAWHLPMMAGGIH
jgi:hypothetical protein